MKSATVSKLKATLSEYLARVKAGEEVLVTERGKPIAKIIPLAPVNSTTSPHLLELARAGLAWWNKKYEPQDLDIKRLVEKAKHEGVVSHLVRDEEDVQEEWFKDIDSVGITSGASAPEDIVQHVVQKIKALFPDAKEENLSYLKEDVHFLLPKELRS